MRVVEAMAKTDPAAQGLCFLYLFAQGMTAIVTSVYLAMDIVVEILDCLSARNGLGTYSVGAVEYAFVDCYVDFLVLHDLARVDYASWKQVREEMQMVGHFIAPLTARGRVVRDCIQTIDGAIGARNSVDSVAIRERFVAMTIDRNGPDEFSLRQLRLEAVRGQIEQQAHSTW